MMANPDPHTVKAFDEDLEEIRALVAEIGGLAELAIHSALEALMRADDAGAARIVAEDVKINRLAQEIERRCICLIALRAPMADDLREILGAFKIAVLLERMGDCARNIAEQVPKAQGIPRQKHLRILQTMLNAVVEMVRSALDAFIKRDPAPCPLVCTADKAVDDLHQELFRELIDLMSECPHSISAATSLLVVSLKLERIGDHAANLARAAFYTVTGNHMPRRSQLSPLPIGAA